MASFCNLSIRKIKSLSSLNGAYYHNETVEGREQGPHIDNEGTFFTMNDNGNASYVDKWYNRVADVEIQTKRKIKPRKDAVYAIEFCAEMSHEMGMTMTDEKIREWAETTKSWVEEKFGKENILGVACHLDESTPHLHITIIPIDKEGHLNSKNLIGGGGKLSWLQTDYAKTLSHLGFKRGIRNSKSKKEDLKRFYNSVNRAFEEKIPERGEYETNEEYLERLNENWIDLRLQALKLKTEISTTKKEHVAFMQEYHWGIKFQNRLKRKFGDEKAEKIFEALNGLSGSEATMMIDKLLENIDEQKKQYGVRLDANGNPIVDKDGDGLNDYNEELMEINNVTDYDNSNEDYEKELN